MSFGPTREGHSTFQALDGNPRWAGIPDVDEAGPLAIQAYLAAYGPATEANLRYWLGEGLGAGGKRIRAWIGGLADRVTEVDVEGDPTWIPREGLEDLLGASASSAVRLLPAYDQWVLGPGTADPHVVPPAHRALVSRGAATVLLGGVVSGTWSTGRHGIEIAWFPDVPRHLAEDVDAEIARMSALLRGAAGTA